MEKDYKKLLRESKTQFDVQRIVDEMVSKDIELEDVADEFDDHDIYRKVASLWNPGKMAN